MSGDIERIAERARSEPIAAWSALAELPALRTTAEVELAAAIAFEVGGLELGRWSEVEGYAGRLLAAPGCTGAEAARIVWRLRGIALLLGREPFAAASAERRGVSGRADACRFAAAAALALTSAARIDEAVDRLEQAAQLAQGLPPEDGAVRLLAQAARRALDRAIDLHGASRRLALAAGNATAAACAGGTWTDRHRAIALRAHALLDLGERRQPEEDLGTLLHLEDVHAAGPGPRCWTTALHCRLQLDARALAGARLAWEACRDFAARMPERDGALDTLLERLRRELDPD